MERKFPKICENLGIPRDVVLFSGNPENAVPFVTKHSGNSNQNFSSKSAPDVREVLRLEYDDSKTKFTYSEPQVSRDFHHFLLSCWLYKYTVHHLLCLYY